MAPPGPSSLSRLLLLGLCVLSWHQASARPPNVELYSSELCSADEYEEAEQTRCEPTCAGRDCSVLRDSGPKCFCQPPKLRHKESGRCLDESECPRDSYEEEENCNSRAKTTKKPTKKPIGKPTGKPTKTTAKPIKPTGKPIKTTVKPTKPTGSTTKRPWTPYPTPTADHWTMKPKPPPPGFKCRANEYIDMTGLCDYECDPSIRCRSVLALWAKCHCKKGYFRDRKIDKCVVKSKCPFFPTSAPRPVPTFWPSNYTLAPARTLPPREADYESDESDEPLKCGPDEYLDTWNHPMCEVRCGDRRPKPCIDFIYNSPKCFCSKPKVRHPETKRCVLESECPNTDPSDWPPPALDGKYAAYDDM